MISKKEAAERLAIIATEIRLAVGENDEDAPTWADDLIAVADALDPSGFVDESVSRIETRYKADAEARVRELTEALAQERHAVADLRKQRDALVAGASSDE